MALNVANGERRFEFATVDLELVEEGCHAIRSNEKQISHGRVSWQAHLAYIAVGPLVTVLVSSII